MYEVSAGISFCLPICQKLSKWPAERKNYKFLIISFVKNFLLQPTCQKKKEIDIHKFQFIRENKYNTHRQHIYIYSIIYFFNFFYATFAQTMQLFCATCRNLHGFLIVLFYTQRGSSFRLCDISGGIKERSLYSYIYNL